MPPIDMRRSRKIQMPKKISAGSTQDSKVVKKLESLPPRNSTLYFSSSLAKAGSTRVVTKLVGLPGSVSLSVPMIRVSVMTSWSTLPLWR